MNVYTRAAPTPEISVVVPIYNEEHVLEIFHRRLIAVLDPAFDYELVYVNDGSSDATASILASLRHTNSHIAVVELSRNFGKEVALTAGLDHARGAAAIVMDADLQDPPELIPQLIDRWREGYDVVYAQRVQRDGETWLKRVSASLFYRAMERSTRIAIPRDVGDYRLLSRRAIDAVGSLRERHRFMKGLFAWIGFKQVAVPFVRAPRHSGNSKWSYGELWGLAVEGFTSFTIAPLRAASFAGFAIAMLSFIYAAIVVFKTLVYGNPVDGYPSLMVVVLFLGGMQLMSLGLIGEYLGRMFNEAKRRPLYLVSAYLPAGAHDDDGQEAPSS